MPPHPGAATAAKTKHPFPVPSRLSPDLARVHAYWRGLLRGSAEMPFWDDVKLTDLPDLADRLFLIDVLGPPERHRFATLGELLGHEELGGRFLDDTDLGSPFEFLRAQATATVECAAPTWFHHETAPGGYARLILPLWGEGRLSMLLGIVDFA